MAEAKERPILFQGDMVQAVLAGDKTETRRIVKPVEGVQPVHDRNFGYKNCPYGEAGDQLWVKETWGITHQYHKPGKNEIVKYRAIGQYLFKELDGKKVLQNPFLDWCPNPKSWTPSIYMPRWASRINLLIRMIDIERVQMIGPYGIEAEGLKSGELNPLLRYVELKDIWTDVWNGINGKPRPVKQRGEITHYNSFPWAEEDRDPRTEINGKPHYCFPNPWVWVVKFKLINEEKNNVA